MGTDEARRTGHLMVCFASYGFDTMVSWNAPAYQDSNRSLSGRARSAVHRLQRFDALTVTHLEAEYTNTMVSSELGTRKAPTHHARKNDLLAVL